MRLQQQQAEEASRQDAARLGAMNSKLTKDFNRVNAIALDLGTQVCLCVCLELPVTVNRLTNQCEDVDLFVGIERGS